MAETTTLACFFLIELEQEMKKSELIVKITEQLR